MLLMHVCLLPYRHNVVFKKGADDICAFFDVKGELLVQLDSISVNNDIGWITLSHNFLLQKESQMYACNQKCFFCVI